LREVNFNINKKNNKKKNVRYLKYNLPIVLYADHLLAPIPSHIKAFIQLSNRASSIVSVFTEGVVVVVK